MSSPKPNALANEKSPYLLQHANNPVDWYPWGDEALTRARDENRPILLSIGYSACHWCHVMERESFEDPAIGALMNEHFVNIKVDREERPDIDSIYMTAVQAMTGSGGWPLTAVLTPDGVPFFAGTYFPPETMHGRPGFTELCERIAEMWKSSRSELVEQAVRGALYSWADTPQGLMALVILLDQFTRNVYRGTPEAFSGDERALALARQAVSQGMDSTMPTVHRIFLYMPFEHAEDLAAQDEGLACFARLMDEAPESQRERIGSFQRYAVAHREVIAQFGRFPHRNRLLGRESTTEELAHLDKHGGF